MVSNPQRYHSRYRLFNEFRDRVTASGANLLTVETAFGCRPFEMTSGQPNEVQLRTDVEIWHKENSINVGIQRLPPNWKYVAWIDADVEFVRPDWTHEIVHTLQHYAVAQLFQSAIDLGPSGESLQTFDSFLASYTRSVPSLANDRYYSSKWHPGFAWAARREAFESLGGLYDTAILGAGDRHMACGLIGKVDQSIAPGLTPSYVKHLRTWQDRAERHIRHNVGAMSGTLLHHWHGKKKDRRYHDRWQILVDHQFDPETDLKRDYQGLWTLTDQGERMRNDLRGYFMGRAEDSTDV